MWGGKWRVRVEESGEASGTAAVEAGGEASGAVAVEAGGEANGETVEEGSRPRGTWENLVWPECRP